MDKNKIMGLTQREVKERQTKGLVNDFTASASTSTWQIVKRNVFTLFNALNFAIALALAFVQAWSNLVFFAVICFNAFSGIVTELRAKHMVDKLNLMTKEKVKTIRDGQEVALNPEELVLGDVIRLSAGEQIPSDALVLEGFAEVNEAMLTGESDLVQKEVDGLLLSGSFLASGSRFSSSSPCWCRQLCCQTHAGSKDSETYQLPDYEIAGQVSRFYWKDYHSFWSSSLARSLAFKRPASQVIRCKFVNSSFGDVT